MGPTRGPPGADRTQVGSVLAPWALLSEFFCFALFVPRHGVIPYDIIQHACVMRCHTTERVLLITTGRALFDPRLSSDLVKDRPSCGNTTWRHQMETFPMLRAALCAGNSPVTGELPPQRPVARSFVVSFDLRPNKPLSKQTWGWWLDLKTFSCDYVKFVVTGDTGDSRYDDLCCQQ